MRQATRIRALVCAMTACAGVLGMTSSGTTAQVPVQDRQPAGSALRPAVIGPSGGVSTGHPLTTAAAFGILLKGGNASDAGVTPPTRSDVTPASNALPPFNRMPNAAAVVSG